MIKTDKIDFKSLVTKNTTLSLNSQTKMTQRLKDTFTEQELQWYIANLYLYLNTNPKDFPINLENVYSLIGFAHKKNAKRTLENNFIKDEDYKINMLPRETIRTGPDSETIMLNVETFKGMCMMSKTDKGKQIRKYYCKLENISNEITIEEKKEYENTIKELNKENEETKKQLLIKTKLKVKKWYNQEPSDVVYAYKSNSLDENCNLISIGKTKNVKDREVGYLTHNQSGEMFHIKQCHNCELTEKVIHHILNKYREEKNKEWFEISKELAIYTIDMVCDFLDMLINSSEKLPEYKITEFINNLPINKFDTSIDLTKKLQIHRPDLIYNDDIKNYKKFIKEMCEICKSETLAYDLIAAYRMWCKKALTLPTKSAFLEYIKNNFKTKEKYNEKTGVRSTYYININIKPFEFYPDNKYDLRLYEKFVIEKCIVNYSNNIKIKDFIENYTNWIKTQLPEYTFTSKEFTEIKDYFNRKLIYDNSMIWGIKINNGIEKHNIKKCNKIHVLNENKETLIIFNGLSEASEKLNLKVKTISDIVRYSKVIEYKNQKVILVYDKEENLIKTKSIKMDPIYKFNYDTKELLTIFYTQKEAIIDLEITPNTISRYINVAKVFNTKKDGNINILLSKLNDITNIKPKIPTKVIKNKPKQIKPLYTYYFNNETNKCTDKLYQEFEGPSSAANKLYIGSCTVYRHIKNKLPLNIKKDDNVISIIFTYTRILPEAE